MKKFLYVFAVLTLCLTLCMSTVEAKKALPIIPLGGYEDNTSSESAQQTPEGTAGSAEGEKTETGQSSVGNADLMQGVSLDLGEDAAPIDYRVKPETPRSTAEVLSVIGSDHSTEIINIDGLEVPLADGSMFYIPFVDIAADAYYTPAVAWAYANDITAGVTELSFGPNQTCTRSQMVTFLWRAAGCPEPTGAASGFSDVSAGSWYEKAVAWAVENKITDGVGDGRFDPNGIVNRAQAVTFLYRAKGAPATAASASFTDVKSGEFYADAVAWAVASDVTNGVGDNAFAPNANCVRGQTVTFLYRAYK